MLMHIFLHLNHLLSTFHFDLSTVDPIIGVNPPESDLNVLIECYFLKFDKQNKNNQNKNNFHFKVRIKHIKRQRENSG